MERIKVGHIYKRQGHGANRDRTFFVKVKDMEGTMVGLDYKLQGHTGNQSDTYL